MNAPIVVGTDGTAPGEAAVRWAAREAARQECVLRIVHAYPEPPEGGDVAERQLTAAVLDAAVAQARSAAAFRIGIEVVPVSGDAVPALLAQEDAALIVLGNRGRGGFASLLLGSVSQRVATYAECPVVVVRGKTGIGGPVVAGIDDSDRAEGVLAAAFDAAVSRNAPLTVVRTYTSAMPLWIGDVPAVTEAVPAMQAEEQIRLDRQLAPWRERFPAVDVDAEVSPDGAAAVLVAVSHSARLMVVGNRGHGTVTNTLLGSTGMQLLHHAGCPVLIVRGTRALAPA